jgi:hypothetical protein
MAGTRQSPDDVCERECFLNECCGIDTAFDVGKYMARARRQTQPLASPSPFSRVNTDVTTEPMIRIAVTINATVDGTL